METIDVADLKDLSDLLARMVPGAEFVLTRDNEPVARISSMVQDAGKRKFGRLRGIVTVGPEFFDPLPEEELAAFE